MQKLQEQKDKCETVTDLGQKIDVCTSAVLLLRDSVDNLAAIAANAAAVAARQNKEVSPSPLFSSPCIEEEESSKEEEDYIPSIISPSSPQENCEDRRAREEAEKLMQSFEAFWDAYGYKRNKKYAWKAWKDKNFGWKLRAAAMAGIAAYKADCERFGHQMCHPATYLHQHRWEDDFDSGLENTIDNIDGKRKQSNMCTREDFRRREREQRMEGYARLAAEFREGNC